MSEEMRVCRNCGHAWPAWHANTRTCRRCWHSEADGRSCRDCGSHMVRWVPPTEGRVRGRRRMFLRRDHGWLCPTCDGIAPAPITPPPEGDGRKRARPAWRDHPATPRQIAYLRHLATRHGREVSEPRTKGEAADAIARLTS